MSSNVVVDIPQEGGVSVNDLTENKKLQFCALPIICYFRESKNKQKLNKLIHSMKVAVALVSVSLLYFLDPLYDEVGDDNAMWAIMTVVVIFEYYAGATLGKGLNRGIGTVLGGGLGCLAALAGQKVGGIGKSMIVGFSVFIFGGLATYTRQIPRIKRTYDYGAMIFILTFSLVAVSGLRVGEVIEIARERLIMIVMGFVICIFISLFVFPIWASDELHGLTISKFDHIATSIEGCLEEYLRSFDEKEKETQKPVDRFNNCKLVLHSKSKDESLANFAKWEPWHGKFGFSYPWEKYLKLGDSLREIATIIASLQGCLQSPRGPTQPLQEMKQAIKEPCEAVGSAIAWTLREMGESIKKMRKCKGENLIIQKMKSVRAELSQVVSVSKMVQVGENAIDGLAVASFVFSLMDIVDKLEDLIKQVEELGEVARFN